MVILLIFSLAGKTKLSWNVAPTARGQGVAKKMLRAILPLLSGLIKAEIKKDNIASIKVAEATGMTLKTEQNGILFYELTKQ
ncbi:Acetyltransferase (GNAT) domain-containing protein [Desulfovibrio litoralis DSM 11393]|uniref:Acetyltransferase (GNAT) domain-containing protein n=1 Tax=Desulfovibrio litoralis DSM 11393 TaxID=1121455 RepID=A0A1M7TQE0_9BACT|nr:Acetyltransferase (GNAT) domain-containing protein [Desulfovibrio litoralis DSM 11393]